MSIVLLYQQLGVASLFGSLVLVIMVPTQVRNIHPFAKLGAIVLEPASVMS
jgi:hypothetical protein